MNNSITIRIVFLLYLRLELALQITKVINKYSFITHLIKIVIQKHSFLTLFQEELFFPFFIPLSHCFPLHH